MSIHMLNYLARHGYLVPAYGRSGRRGKTRYYSYRDLVIARLVQRLLNAGLEISRLKQGIRRLKKHPNLTHRDPQKELSLLATDGNSLFFLEREDTLLDLTRHGQLAFAFVLDVTSAQADVKQKLSDEQLAHFAMYNLPLKYIDASTGRR
jgi:DNA-binding transcriptional MerR regulator